MYKRSDIELSNGTKFTVWTNIEHQGMVSAALDNWLARTNKFTAESFVEYINDKGAHKALTQKQFNKHPNKERLHLN